MASGTGCAVLAYEEADDRWRRIAMLPEPRHHHAGAIVDDNLYILGESFSIVHFSSAEQFRLEKK